MHVSSKKKVAGRLTKCSAMLAEIKGCELLLRTSSVLFKDGTPDDGYVERAVRGTGTRSKKERYTQLKHVTFVVLHLPCVPCCAQVTLRVSFCFSLLLLCMEEEVLEGTAAWIEIWVQ